MYEASKKGRNFSFCAIIVGALAAHPGIAFGEPNWIGLETDELPKPVRFMMNPWNLDIHARGACFGWSMCASYTDEARAGGPLPVLKVLKREPVEQGELIILTVSPLICYKLEDEFSNTREEVCALDLMEYRYGTGRSEYECRLSYGEGVLDGRRDGKYYSTPCSDIYLER